jgi:hypothetical protein
MRLHLVPRIAALWALPLVLVAPHAFAQPSQAASGAQCSAARLVGTWERISLLRNGLSVQPPDAPLFVKFGGDGYWSMMEMPDRPIVAKPFDQLTAKELWSRFDKVEGSQGTWTIAANGSVVTRAHRVNIAPGGENSNQDRACIFEGEILALIGMGANRSPQARFKRLPPEARSAKAGLPAQQAKPHALVGTWERTALTIDGKTVQPPAAAQIVILGEDGWFSQTQLPTGRTRIEKPMEQYTVDDYMKAFAGVAAARGTYVVDGNTLTRKHVADIDPALVGSEDTGQFTVEGDAMTLRGSSRSGKYEATFKRLKPVEMTSR